MADSAAQRKNMVESQVRPSDVTDRRITAAMQSLARETFVPAALQSLAYMDEALYVAPGRAMIAPRNLARLIQLAQIENTDVVLNVGALNGYSAALLSTLAKSVVALESDAGCAAKLTQSVADHGLSNVTIARGDLAAGYPAGAPYDVIWIEGAVEQIADALAAQLSVQGRIVAVAFSDGVACAAIWRHDGSGSLNRRCVFEADAPLLPGFETPKGFVF